MLERMNSVLEPEREILLAEKIGQEGKGIAFTPEELSRPAIVKQREPGVNKSYRLLIILDKSE